MIGLCSKCPLDIGEQELINGLCNMHYWSQLRQKSKPLKRNLIIKPPQGLNVYYNYHIANSTWICENCHQPIPHFSYKVRRSCQAHIVPKEHFKSVALVLENHLLLGGIHSECGCHYAYDFSWERASKMPVIEIAKQKFLSFMHLISPLETKRLPQFFLSLLSN